MQILSLPWAKWRWKLTAISLKSAMALLHGMIYHMAVLQEQAVQAVQAVLAAQKAL
jgi:hypothetical protein